MLYNGVWLIEYNVHLLYHVDIFCDKSCDSVVSLCTVYSGPLDPIHGNAPFQKVRSSAQVKCFFNIPLIEPMHISVLCHIERPAFVLIQELASLLFNDTMSLDSGVAPCKKVTTSMGKWFLHIHFVSDKIFGFLNYIGFDVAMMFINLLQDNPSVFIATFGCRLMIYEPQNSHFQAFPLSL